jgi:hypothetical protein
MLTEEQIENNFNLYLKKISEIGIDIKLLTDDFKQKLKYGSFATSADTNEAYPGSLIEIVLMKLTPYAVKINELYPKVIQVEKSEVVKICLLHHISKAIRMIYNDNEWERDKRGMVYKFNPENPSIRTGLHSLIICQNLNIQFTPIEAEAMTIMDRDADDMQAKLYPNLLSSIVREANEMANREMAELKKIEK